MPWVLIQEARGGNPERTYRIETIFSLHTFTRSKEAHHDDDLSYSDSREQRTFCFERYKDSKHLPAIIRDMGMGYVQHTGHQNFLRIDTSHGTYEIYFVVRRSKKSEFDLEIFVQSAYARSKGNSPKAGKIKFYVVAYNTLHNKPIKPPRR
tara:strand:+ start:1052 stop:1504 length:453 start_codon:yes stop_codon:yes gene_type:complete